MNLIDTLLSILASVLAIVYLIWNHFSKQQKDNMTEIEPLSGDQVLGLVERFIKLFEAHGIARTQIPGFLKGFGITLSLADVRTDNALLHKLDESILNNVCKIFAVRREWLDGADTQVHLRHNFYKYPEKFLEFIEELKNSNPDAELDGVLIAPNELGYAEALIILQEGIGNIGEKPVYRYHLCNNWLFSYWKARAYLTACIAISWKKNINIYGSYLPMNEIDRLASGETLLGWHGEGIYTLGHARWYPEDMALVPDTFLKGVAPEDYNFGIISSLRLWLELEKKGFMNTGMGENKRENFQQRLEEELVRPVSFLDRAIAVFRRLMTGLGSGQT